MEILSRVHAKNLVAWAKDKPEVLVLSADLTASTEIDLFRDAYPDRFLSLGIAEQNMLSFAGGLAREGFSPWVHTFAVFLYRRAYDQIAMSLAYPNLPVRLVGFLPGITTPGGATHQAVEDLALMRALPNMTVLECGDATEVESVLEAAQSVPGPVYIRMLRGEIPRLFPAGEPLKLGKCRHLSAGQDLAIFSSGICTEEALKAIPLLIQKGLSVQHLHVATLKPFPEQEALAALAPVRLGVISLENHSVINGLGTCLAEALARAGLGKRLIKLGLQDTFAHGASRPYLMREYGLDALALIAAVEQLIGHSLGLDAQALAAVPLSPRHSLSQPEAL